LENMTEEEAEVLLEQELQQFSARLVAELRR
jgi:hypothetical protein